MATKSPLARVKEEFGGKDKLVDKIVGLIDLEAQDESKDDLRRRLLGAANRKLVRLHGIASRVKEAGGKDQLAAATAEDMGHGKDKDFVTKLTSYSAGRLLDMRTSAQGRAQARKKAAEPKRARPAAKPPAVVAKAAPGKPSGRSPGAAR
jgi:hypothetical protein